MRRLAFFAVISLCCVLSVEGKTHSGHQRHSSGKKSDSSARSQKTIEEATRLQVFLDRAPVAESLSTSLRYNMAGLLFRYPAPRVPIQALTMPREISALDQGPHLAADAIW